jgi:hypothetical protein
MSDEQTTSELVARLMKACNGHPYAKITWPHTILHEAKDRLEALQARVDALEAAALALVEAWHLNENGQIDGELIEPFIKETP